MTEHDIDKLFAAIERIEARLDKLEAALVPPTLEIKPLTDEQWDKLSGRRRSHNLFSVSNLVSDIKQHPEYAAIKADAFKAALRSQAYAADAIGEAAG